MFFPWHFQKSDTGQPALARGKASRVTLTHRHRANKSAYQPAAAPYGDVHQSFLISASAHPAFPSCSGAARGVHEVGPLHLGAGGCGMGGRYGGSDRRHRMPRQQAGQADETQQADPAVVGRTL